MKDLQIAYKEKLENILNLIKDGQYSCCYNVSNDLIKFAWMMELEDEVFISEVLESVFIKMDFTTEDYFIPENIAQQLQKDLGSKMENIIKAYPDKDPQKLYACLKELIYVATHYQLHTSQKYPKRQLDGFQREMLAK